MRSTKLGIGAPPTQIGFDGGQARESIECRGMSPPKVRPKSITEYIEAAPNRARKELPEMLSCIGRVATDATEGLRWVMPARSYKRILATLAAHKNHIGFYPAPSALKAFAKELAEFNTASGSIQFLLEKPLPLPLLRKITEFRVKESLEQDRKWRT